MNEKKMMRACEEETNLNDYVFLRWDHLSEKHGLKALQETEKSCFWGNEEPPPRLILFVSHRWETANHPDPQFKQARALVSLRELTSKALAENHCPENVSVRTLTRIMRKRDCGIGDVALWYDYSCLPQKIQGRQRSCEETQAFHEALSGLVDIVMMAPCTLILSLRWREDGYESSGWCFFECMIGRTHGKSITWVVDDSDSPKTNYTEQLVADLVKATESDTEAPFFSPSLARLKRFKGIVDKIFDSQESKCISKPLLDAMAEVGLSVSKHNNMLLVGLFIYALESKDSEEISHLRRQIERQMFGCCLREMERSLSSRGYLTCAERNCFCESCNM
jgi:hypothetical protein